MSLNKTDITWYARSHRTTIYPEYYTTFPNYATTQVYATSLSSFDMIMFTTEIIILALAIIGNSLTFCICMRRDKRRRSFMLYLAALSVSDTLNCCILIVSYIHANIDVTWSSPVLFCKLMTFGSNSVKYISSWLTVAISVEITVSTKLPHHVARISRQGFGIKTISVIGVVSVILSSHFLYGYTGVAEGSMISCPIILGPYVILMAYLYPIVDALVYSLIPGFLIILCNTIMVKAVFTSARIRGTISDQASKRNRELLIVAVLINISFIILTSPICLFIIFSGVTHDLEAMDSHEKLRTVLTVISFANNGITFYLYIISGSRFRQQLKELFRCKFCFQN